MKVNIVDIRCTVNNNNNPVGHEKKAIRQAVRLLECEKEVTVGKFYNGSVDGCKVKNNVFCIKVSDNIFVKYIKLIINSYIVIKKNRADVIWFVLIEEVMLWILLLMPKKSKYIITTYIDWEQKFSEQSNYSHTKIRWTLFRKALKKIDLVISTNAHFQLKDKQINIPDFYLEPQYKRYIYAYKQGVVCVGVMNRNKGILEIAKAFGNSNIKIVISGYFTDEEYFKNVKQFENDNVIINNVILDYDEYMQIIGNAKYVIMPYSNSSHKYRTSGVLQETIALNSIPVAFPEFLEYNSVEGIAFEKYEDIPLKIEEYELRNEPVHNNWKEFDYDCIKAKLKEKIFFF